MIFADILKSVRSFEIVDRAVNRPDESTHKLALLCRQVSGVASPRWPDGRSLVLVAPDSLDKKKKPSPLCLWKEILNPLGEFSSFRFRIQSVLVLFIDQNLSEPSLVKSQFNQFNTLATLQSAVCQESQVLVHM